MVYNPLIPQPGSNLSASQGQILENFTQLNTIFGYDHFAYDDGTVANRGLHKKIDFPVVTTVSAPSGTASVIYAKSVSGVASPYFRNSVGDEVMWRGGSTNGLVSATFANPGELNLPNGFKLKWGTGQFLAGNPTTAVVFSTPFTNDGLVATVTLDAANPVSSVGATDIASGGFNARRGINTTNSANFRWIVIGY